MTERLLRPLTLAVVLALLITAAVVILVVQRPQEKRLTAEFSSTISLYQGAKVKILGVDVGTVQRIQVRGTRVHVEMTYQAQRQLPANVHAVVVPPSIVGDRFIQLTPAYNGGPVLPDGASLARERTEVPVELDQTYRSLNDIASALGPKGANSDGALSRLLTASARNLHGNGAAINTTIRRLTDAVSTLSTSRGDIAGTVTNVGDITRTLAGDDGEVRALTVNLARVASQLGGQRDDISTATSTLADALRRISTFVAENKKGLTDNVSGLTKVTRTLAERTGELSELLDIAPLGLSNLMDIYEPQNWDLNNPGAVAPQARTGSLTLRAPLLNDLPIQLGHTMSAICGNLPETAQRQLTPLCTALQNAGGDLGKVLTRLIDPAAGGGLTPSGAADSLTSLLRAGQP